MNEVKEMTDETNLLERIGLVIAGVPLAVGGIGGIAEIVQNKFDQVYDVQTLALVGTATLVGLGAIVMAGYNKDPEYKK